MIDPKRTIRSLERAATALERFSIDMDAMNAKYMKALEEIHDRGMKEAEKIHARTLEAIWP